MEFAPNLVTFREKKIRLPNEKKETEERKFQRLTGNLIFNDFFCAVGFLKECLVYFSSYSNSSAYKFPSVLELPGMYEALASRKPPDCVLAGDNSVD